MLPGDRVPSTARVMSHSHFHQNRCLALVDLLSRSHNDLMWIMRTNIPESCSGRNAQQIRDFVFEDEEIRSLLHHSPSLRPQIENILEEMAHNWSPAGIRFVGFFVTKILRNVCSSLLVDRKMQLSPKSPLFCVQDEELAATIRRFATEAPILYLPNHRSYADFIILSYVCFSMGLPLPSIAAGTDFLSLDRVASLLRACGAFFIRRSSLKSDSVYWTTFRAYVEQQILSRDRPIEFFVEGTRSRTGKSLPPKTGLLKIAVSLFLSGAITDLIILPISLSYDRILEEKLFAHEVSPQKSAQKPPETTAHLIQGAKAILNQNYGSMHVRFCEPISVRAWFNQLTGRDVRRTGEQNRSRVSRLVTRLAHDVVREQVRGTVLSAFDLFCFVIVAQHANQTDFGPNSGPSQVTVSLTETLDLMKELLHLVPFVNRGHTMQRCDLVHEDVSRCIQLHVQKFADVTGHQLTLTRDMICFNMRMYANKLLQLVIDECICSHVQTFERFFLVKQVLAAEFCSSDIVHESFTQSRGSVSSISDDLSLILSSYVVYYLRSYLRVCVWMEGRECEELTRESAKSLTRSAASNLQLPSDVISGFLELVPQRVAASAVPVRVVLHKLRHEILSLLANNRDMAAGDAVQSKL